MREPERHLEPPEEPVYFCPVCGAESPEKIYTVPGQGPIGCDICLCAYEPWEWFERSEVR